MNKKKNVIARLLERIEKSPLWSTVIGTLLGSLVLWLSGFWRQLTELVLVGYLKLVDNYEIAGWILIPLIIVSTYQLYCIITRLIPFFSSDLKRRYLMDRYNEVNWRWKWYANDLEILNYPTPYCPQDDSKLIAREDLYICPKCRFFRTLYPKLAANEIERRARTGEWKKAIKRLKEPVSAETIDK